MKKYLFILISVSCFGQFNPVQWYEFGGISQVNTFIGGIGGTINTRELLATELGINSGKIKKFSISGSDIECAVIGLKYTMSNIAFTNDLTITYFEDNKCNQFDSRSFAGAENLEYIRLLEAAIVLNGGSAFIRNYVLNEIYIPKCSQLGATSGDDGLFNSLNPFQSGCVITVSSVLQTNNGGMPDGDIVTAIAKGATIVYVP